MTDEQLNKFMRKIWDHCVSKFGDYYVEWNFDDDLADLCYSRSDKLVMYLTVRDGNIVWSEDTGLEKCELSKTKVRLFIREVKKTLGLNDD